MTNQELINHLLKFPSDMLVFVEGYEGGYDELETVEQKDIRKTSFPSPFSGTHDEFYPSLDNESIKLTVIVLPR